MKFDAKTVFVQLKQADHVTQPDGAGDDDLWEVGGLARRGVGILSNKGTRYLRK